MNSRLPFLHQHISFVLAKIAPYVTMLLMSDSEREKNTQVHIFTHSTSSTSFPSSTLFLCHVTHILLSSHFLPPTFFLSAHFASEKSSPACLPFPFNYSLTSFSAERILLSTPVWSDISSTPPSSPCLSSKSPRLALCVVILSLTAAFLPPHHRVITV